jgi:2-haloacid dehalogenase
MALPVYVFDAYGTLLNVHAAIARHRTACGPDADRLSDLWRSKQLEYTWTLTLAGQYEDFWVLTERALDFAMARYPSVGKDLRSKLLEAYFMLEAFPDAGPVLQSLKDSGHRTAILSNGSPAMLAAAVTAARMDPVLDQVLSVDVLRLYKPRAEVYALATNAFAVAPEDVVFVSSNRWDIMGASAFGFRCVWLNRNGGPDEYPDQPPRCIIADMAALPSAAA